MILDHPTIAARYFFPRHDALDSPFWVTTADGEKLACARFEPPNAHGKWVLYFHGNGEVAADYVPDFARECERLGLGLCIGEYRGYGGSTGRPAVAKMLDDAAAILAALETAPEQVIIFGRSVGSIYAIELARRYRNIAGLILESGIADVRERLLLRVDPRELGATEEAFDAAIAEHLDHETKLAGYAGPILVLHAARDSLVDVSHGERLFAWAGGEKKKIRVFARGDHNSILAVNYAEYFAEVAAFVAEIFGPLTDEAEPTR